MWEKIYTFKNLWSSRFVNWHYVFITACNVGDEGGFAPNIQENREGLELLKEAIEKAGYTGKIKIGMDVAASEFFKDGKYDLDFKNPNSDPSKFVSGSRYLTFCISLMLLKSVSFNRLLVSLRYLWVIALFPPLVKMLLQLYDSSLIYDLEYQ